MTEKLIDTLSSPQIMPPQKTLFSFNTSRQGFQKKWISKRIDNCLIFRIMGRKQSCVFFSFLVPAQGPLSKHAGNSFALT